jgi:hypothetical protein
MKRAPKILLGCLALPFVVIFALALLAVVFRAAGSPGHREETANLEQPLTSTSTPGQLAAEGLVTGGGPPSGQTVGVNIWLEEGNFTIKAGPAGSAARVEGNYDAGAYELKQELKQDASGAPAYYLSFRPRYSMLRRMLSEGGVHIDDDDNKITIYLPRGVPMALNTRASKGKTDLQLGGLTLEKASLELRMGEHHISVDEANPMEMSSLEIHAGMGELRFKDLGNLRAETITMFSKMGEVDVDLGDKIHRDTKMYVSHKMGQLTVGLPRGARVRAHATSFLGPPVDNPTTVEGEATGPLLDITAGMTMGELRFHKK